jgi:hypothetical protein
MLHVSTPVRYRDAKRAATHCPTLVWTGDAFMIALSAGNHSHPTLQIHGERISVDDAALGGPLLVGADSEVRVEMLRVAVNFFSGERLVGICWVDARAVQQAKALGSTASVHCNPDDLWLK